VNFLEEFTRENVSENLAGKRLLFMAGRNLRWAVRDTKLGCVFFLVSQESENIRRFSSSTIHMGHTLFFERQNKQGGPFTWLLSCLTNLVVHKVVC